MDKFWLKSKTVLGALFAAAPAFLGLFGYSVAPGASDDVQAIVAQLMTVSGALFAIYGRFKAGGLIFKIIP